MMSEQRARKTASIVQNSRGRASVTKGSGDTEQAQQRMRSKSKNKIPKTLRNDLENALVGLCDVWFEEIKPHLMQNNIKLHMHSGPASGDHPVLPVGMPGCPHLDPGAALDRLQPPGVSFADSCSTQRTASRARSRRPPVPSCSQASRLNAPTTGRSTQIQNPCQSYNSKAPRHLRRRQPPHEWREPRLCRTDSLLSPDSRVQPQRRPATVQHTHQVTTKHLKRRPKTADKATQTPPLRFTLDDIYPRIRLKVNIDEKNPKRKQKKRRAKPHHSLFSQPQSRSNKPDEEKMLTFVPSPCLRRQATTTIIPRQNRKHKQLTVPPLFKDDLIDIIAKGNEKHLKLLFMSPPRHDQPSTMNLLTVARCGAGKKTPWR